MLDSGQYSGLNAEAVQLNPFETEVKTFPTISRI